LILFVWGGLSDPKLLSFILRRAYEPAFEAALLPGWMPGDHHPGMLFPYAPGDLDAQIAHGLTPADFVKLDRFHALDEGIHKRVIQRVNVIRNGSVEYEHGAHVYIAGPSFTKLKEGRLT
jgi:hypothetical protein